MMNNRVWITFLLIILFGGSIIILTSSVLWQNNEHVSVPDLPLINNTSSITTNTHTTSSFTPQHTCLDNISSTNLRVTEQDPIFQYIAHTLGITPDGQTGSNTKEAFEHSYSKGFRLFEADFLQTKDGHVIVAHDNHEGYWGIPSTFEHTEYHELATAKFMNTYTTLDIDSLLHLMQRYPDTYIIIDIKFTTTKDYDNILNKITTRSIEILGTTSTYQRFIPQVYVPDDLSRNTNLCNFSDIIFTLYRNTLTWDEVINVLKKYPKISAVATPYPTRYSPTHHQLLDTMNVGLYVHPVTSSTVQQQLIKKQLGVFTSVSTTIR